MRRLRRTCLALAVIAGYATTLTLIDDEPRSSASAAASLDDAAAQYVRLALEFDRVRPGEVDSYFGPAALRPSAAMRPEDPSRLAVRAHELQETVRHVETSDPARRSRLAAHVASLAARLDASIASHRRRLLDEARILYGIDVPRVDPAQVEQARRSLERQIPGDRPLHVKVHRLRQAALVPADRRRAVFARALATCRAATRRQWALPADESLDVTWDTSGGAAWHRYQGGARSRLLVNPAAVATVESAIDVACHEGYPGHHAQFLLADTGARLPLEERVGLLRSPASVLREGAAQYGVDLVLPAPQRLAVERDVLAPLAGIDRQAVERLAAARPHLRVLERLVPEILAAWDEAAIDEAIAIQRLGEEALVPAPAALVRFTRDYGAYVVAYTAARDRVAAAVAAEQQRTGLTAWQVLRDMLAPPRPERMRRPS